MIISQLTGGLGNQMFQYAFGFALSKRLGAEYKLHFVSNLCDSPRVYELDKFNISATPASAGDLKHLRISQSKIQLLFQKIHILKSNIRSEGSISFQKSALNYLDDSYLQGYWQSELYFPNVSSELRKEFTFKRKLTGKNKSLANHIKNHTAISVHIRRGDYVDNAKTNIFHGVCGIDYYKMAKQFIGEKVKNPTFYYFSDDPEWVKQNFKSNWEDQYVDWNVAKNSHIDMQLMSLCNHNIVANSSFSWWSAWLNSNPKKIIIAPSQWYANPHIDTSTIVPKDWMKI